MDRLTSHEISDLMEAYNAVYAPKEEVVEEEEIVNEDLIGDIRANAGRVVRGVQSAAGAANRAASAVNQAMVNRITPKPTAGDYKSRFARPMNAGTPQQTGRATAVSRPQVGGLPSNYRGQELQAGARAAASQVGTARQGSAGTGAAPSAAAPRPAARPAAAPAPAARPAAPVAARPAAAPAPAVKTTPSAPAAPAPKPANPLMANMPTVPSTAAPAGGVQLSARAQALKAGGPKGGARERMLNQDLDLFDIIKGYLLDERYADTEEAALVIMANMSEEWKKSILEG